MRLLWVENHAVFARMAGKQFLAGHDLTVVPSLARAREVLAAEAFEAVLLDYDLDDGKGASLIEFIRQLPYVPIVVATSSHEEGNTSLLAAGADAACSKGHFAEINEILSRSVEITLRGKADTAFDRKNC
jgi:CheY-like chemotaxis protein